MIVPHAGYIYSGPVAASAYATLAENRHTIRRVVLIGPDHRVGFRGIAAPSADWFETPLGRIPVDQQVIDELTQLDNQVLATGGGAVLRAENRQCLSARGIVFYPIFYIGIGVFFFRVLRSIKLDTLAVIFILILLP